MNSINIIAEIGINHNGSVDKAKRLIDIASVAGCDYVKFQKRDPDICVPDEQKNKSKRVPWRSDETTYLQYKKDIEFQNLEYNELIDYSFRKGLFLFSSVWDISSCKFMSKLTDTVKIPSAQITNIELLKKCKGLFKRRIMSTGMSTEKEIEKAVETLNPQVIMHTNSTYPCSVENLNLKYIEHLKEKFPEKEIGYSNHFFGLMPCFASVALGSKWVEVHICEDHRDWGSDQSSSVEPIGLFKLVRGIRDLEQSLKGNNDRVIYKGEEEKRKTLRKN